jgi:Concanavalin A-like lectin/glucanases superfamily/Regulator of chromosome condensation (RCC1) repeat
MGTTSLIAWGNNRFGQLNVPNATILPNNVYSGILNNISKVSVGLQHVLALTSNGNVITWGTGNHFGQQNLPNFPYPVSDITAYGNNSYFVLQDGLALSCGEMVVYKIYPANGITNVKKIVAGGGFGVALKNDGTLTGWGADPYGIISYVNSGVSNVKDIYANATTLLVYKTNNTITQTGISNYIYNNTYVGISKLYGTDYYGFLIGANGGITGYQSVNISSYISNPSDYTVDSNLSSSKVYDIQGIGNRNIAVINSPLSSGTPYQGINNYVFPCNGLTYAGVGILNPINTPPPTPTPIQVDSGVLNSIVAYWNMEDSLGLKLNSVNSNTFALYPYNTVGTTSGIIGNAAIFSGATNGLYNINGEIGNVDFNTSGFTIAGWINLLDTSHQSIIFVHGSSYPYVNKWITYNDSINPNTLSFYMKTSYAGGTTYSVSITGMSAGNWTFFAMRWIPSSGLLQASINTGVWATSPVTGTSLFGANPQFSIGSYNSPYLDQTFTKYSAYFGVDEFGIWSGALTDIEIVALYNQGNGRTYNFLS